MATSKKAAETVEETESTATESSAETETVTIPKSQLEEILAKFDEQQAQIDKLTANAAAESKTKTAEERKLEEEKKLLEVVNQANAEAEEEVEIHVDMGSLRSNKNLEVGINGTQMIIPKGQNIKVQKRVAEVIENSKKQRDISLGLQAEKAKEAEEAEAAGGI
jgi:hypothetical protein